MSPLWRDRLCIGLSPLRLTIARIAGIWRSRLVHKNIIPVMHAEPGVIAWQPMLDALQEYVANGDTASADITLVLSSHLAHYTLVPWSELLAGEGEELAFARQCFADTYGNIADRWAIRLTDGSPGATRLACAVDRDLLEAIDAIMAPLGRRYRSLQPHLMKSFNAWRRRLRGKGAWLVIAEEGVLSLSLLENGEWQAVNTIKVDDSWPMELPFILEREGNLCHTDSECNQVFLFSAESADKVTCESDRWNIENLRPPPMVGFVHDVDALFSVAVLR